VGLGGGLVCCRSFGDGRGRFSSDFGRRLEHWRALAKLGAGQGVDAVGDRGGLRLVLGFNVGCRVGRGGDGFRCGGRSSFDYRGFERRGNAGFREVLNCLCGQYCGCRSGLFLDRGTKRCGGRSVVAGVGAVVATGVAAALAVIAAGAIFASRPAVEIAKGFGAGFGTRFRWTAA
jgi:hypothetical protein